MIPYLRSGVYLGILRISEIIVYVKNEGHDLQYWEIWPGFRARLTFSQAQYAGGPDDHIKWPPNNSFKMSIAGFEECYQHSVSAKLSKSPELIVQVVGLSGLVILKLISWNDNPERQRKDASDLHLIIQNYVDAGNLDRLFNEHLDLAESDNYDYELASARLLGRDISKIASRQTKVKLVRILEREAANDQGHRIAIDVRKNDEYRWLDYGRTVEAFNWLLKGLTDDVQQ